VTTEKCGIDPERWLGFDREVVMCFVFSLIPATILVIVGYFILFSTTKTQQGAVQLFGYILSAWVFIVSAFFPAMGAYASISGACPSMQTMMQSMHPRASP
jgi:hypothetical protein